MLSIIILSSIIFTSCLFAKTACIIVHGTWAKHEKWYQPGGDFFEVVKALALGMYDEIIPFSWSGKNKAQDRFQAGKDLAVLIEKYDSVVLIAHSHGANVGIIASHFIAQNQECKKYKIEKFYALGVPVKTDLYPMMHVIRNFYNMFSFSDKVQRVLGFFDRIFVHHPRIANLALVLDNKAPSHSQLHHKEIGRWLLFIHEHLWKYNKGRFGVFAFHKPGIIRFYTNQQDPEYMYDYKREELLKKDVALMNMCIKKLASFYTPKFS